MHPASNDVPDDLHTSVTLFSQVTSHTEVVENTTDKLFVMGISEYIRDHIQTFNIRFAATYTLFRPILIRLHRCRLNRTTSKRWDNTSVPTNGSTVLISGYLDGENPHALLVEIETMQFIAPPRSGESAGSPQAPGRMKFGIPKGFAYALYEVYLLLTTLRQDQRAEQ